LSHEPLDGSLAQRTGKKNPASSPASGGTPPGRVPPRAAWHRWKAPIT